MPVSQINKIKLLYYTMHGIELGFNPSFTIRWDVLTMIMKIMPSWSQKLPPNMLWHLTLHQDITPRLDNKSLKTYHRLFLLPSCVPLNLYHKCPLLHLLLWSAINALYLAGWLTFVSNFFNALYVHSFKHCEKQASKDISWKAAVHLLAIRLSS